MVKSENIHMHWLGIFHLKKRTEQTERNITRGIRVRISPIIYHHQTSQIIQVLGLLEENIILLSLRNSYFCLASDSLLKSEINIVVLPPSRIIGYLSFIDPINSFESRIFNRCRSSIILYSKVSFFIFACLIAEYKFNGMRPKYG